MNRHHYYPLAIVTGLATSFVVIQQSLALSNEEVYRRVRPSVVLVQNMAGARQGTGFIVSRTERNGTYTYYVLTAGHIVKDGRLQIQTDSREVSTVEVFASSSGDDLALLQFNSNQRYEPVNTLDNGNLSQPGRSILILGYPLAGTGDPEIVDGIVTSRPNQLISHNVETKPGMSGSPVLDEFANVVGIHIRSEDSNFRSAIPIERYKLGISLIFLDAARSNLRAEKFIEAIASIQERRRLLGQDDSESLMILAYAHFGNKELNEAKDKAINARRLGNNKEELTLLLGAINYLQGNPNDAINDLRLISNNGNFSSYAFAILAPIYASGGNQPEATRNSLNAVQALPTDPLVYFARSYTSYKLGNDPEARTNFNAGNERRGQNPSNVFLAVLSPTLQASAIQLIPESLRSPLRDDIARIGPYKSSEPINLGVSVTTIAVSKNSKSVATGLADGNVYLYDLQSRNRYTNFTVGQEGTPISSVAFSPDNTSIAIASGSGQVKVFDIQSRREKYNLANAGDMPVIIFSDNGRYLYIGSNSGTLRMIDTRSNEAIVNDSNAHPGGINSLTLSSDGRLLASGGIDGTVRIRGANNLDRVDDYPAHQRVVQFLAFSADGNRIISAGGNDIKSCDWQKKECSPVTSSSDAIAALAISNNGHIAFSENAFLLGAQPVLLRNLKTNQVLGNLSGHSDRVTALVYTPDSRYLISGSADKTIIIWEVLQ